MEEQGVTLFDFMDESEKSKWKPKETMEWKWTFKDYPQKKNGLKVFSCFACGGAVQWGISLPAVR